MSSGRGRYKDQEGQFSSVSSDSLRITQSASYLGHCTFDQQLSLPSEARNISVRQSGASVCNVLTIQTENNWKVIFFHFFGFLPESNTWTSDPKLNARRLGHGGSWVIVFVAFLVRNSTFMNLVGVLLQCWCYSCHCSSSKKANINVDLFNRHPVMYPDLREGTPALCLVTSVRILLHCKTRGEIDACTSQTKLH